MNVINWIDFSLFSSCDYSSVDYSLWRWSIWILSLQLVPPWLEVRAMKACQAQRCLRSSVSSLCSFFASLTSPLPLLSLLSHSQSNYWNSCINCQRLLTWPCPCEGNSARSWCSPWLNAQAPSFWMMERRYASLHLCFSLSGDQNFSFAAVADWVFVLPFKFFSALLTLGCLSDCPHHKAFRRLKLLLLIPLSIKTVFSLLDMIKIKWITFMLALMLCYICYSHFWFLYAVGQKNSKCQ